MVKLNNRKIARIIKHVSSRELSTKDAATTYNISQRRVEQLTKKYLEQRKIPEINPNRRPKTSPTRAGVEGMQSPLWEETRFGSKHLYKELKRRGHSIPKDKLIQYMKKQESQCQTRTSRRKRRDAGIKESTPSL